MGLEMLEKKFQNYLREHPENISRLKLIAEKISSVQKKMRGLLDSITSEICRKCSTSCCSTLPVEGWFTESDYFIYRTCYEAPFHLKLSHDNETACVFLGTGGCVLPADMRPFPCVKVNCKWVSKELNVKGSINEFNQLNNDLGEIQKKLWGILKGTQF